MLVTWTASTDAGGRGVAGYRVFRDASATPIATVTCPTLHRDTGLTAATTYSYTVRAFDAATTPNVSAASAAADCHYQRAAGGRLGSRCAPVEHELPRGRSAEQHGLDRRPARIPEPPAFTSRSPCCRSPATTRAGTSWRRPAPCACSTTPRTPTTSRVFHRRIVARLNSDPNSSNDERGLLGMAFHPNYPTDPRLYLFYTGTDTTLGLRRSHLRIPHAGQWQHRLARQRAHPAQRRRPGKQPQRRQHRLRPRRLSLHRHR